MNITGTIDNHALDGTAGNDTITGLAGDNDLFGGGGNDLIEGGAGTDYIEGGNGDDILRPGVNTCYDIVRPGRGNDLVDFTGADATDGFFNIFHSDLDS